MNIHRPDRRGIATICGDVIYDFNDQIVTPFHEIHDASRAPPATTATASGQEKAAIKKLLSSSRFLLPVHDRPAKIEGGQVVGRLHDSGARPDRAIAAARNWFPA